MDTVAIIAAAGKGKRIGGKVPKPYIKINGRPLLYYTISKFNSSPHIDGIVIAVASNRLRQCQKIIDRYKLKKVFKVVKGGVDRACSVYNAFKVLTPHVKIVIVHDGVRPLVKKELISKVINVARRHGTAVPAVQPRATIKERSKNWINRTLPRNRLVEIQTPQAFRYSILREGYRKYSKISRKATDTSYLAELAGHKIKLVEGDYGNIKVTTKEDLDSARSIIGETVGDRLPRTFFRFPLKVLDKKMRGGIGYDIHPLVAGRALVLGGVRIPARVGLKGHSDADVLLHAITDAILGSTGRRDIGWHFPDTRKRYKNMDSKHFLVRAKGLAQKRKYKVKSVDSIVIAQEPRLQPYYTKMVKNISKWLGLPQNRVTVKFCSPEGLGPLGHRKAIASLATVTVQK